MSLNNALTYSNAQQTGVTNIVQSTSVDLDKLYHAVAVAESGTPTNATNYCGTPWHTKAKNCVSILTWTGGKRHLKQFASFQDNVNAFKSLWVRAYGGGLPTMQDAIKYTGNQMAYGWRATVISTYKKLTQ